MALVRGVIVIGLGWQAARTAGVVIAERTERFFPRYAPLAPFGPPTSPTAITSSVESAIDLGWANGTPAPADTEVWVSLDNVTFALATTVPLSTRALTYLAPVADVLTYFKFRHINPTAASAYSATVSAKSQKAIPAGAPVAVSLTPTAAPGGETTLQAAWTTGDPRFFTEVYLRIPAINGAFALMATTTLTATVLQTLTGLTAGTTYEVKFRHILNGITSAYSSAIQGSTLVDAPNGPPLYLSVGAGSVPLNLALSWTPGDVSARTWLYMATTFGGTYSFLVDLPAGQTSYTHAVGAYNATRYYYAVHMKNGVASTASNIASGATPANAPIGNPLVRAVALGQPLSETAVGYEVIIADPSADLLFGVVQSGGAVIVASGTLLFAAGSQPAGTWLRPANLTGLPLNTNFVISVWARKSGLDSSVASATLTTTLDGPNAAPSGLGVTALGLGSYQLTWTNGDPTANTVIVVNGASVGSVGPGVNTYTSGFAAGAPIKVYHEKNGVYSAFSNIIAV